MWPPVKLVGTRYRTRFRASSGSSKSRTGLGEKLLLSKEKDKGGSRAVLTRLGDFLFFLFLDSHTTVNDSEVSRVIHSHDLLNLDNVREFLLYLPV